MTLKGSIKYNNKIANGEGGGALADDARFYWIVSSAWNRGTIELTVEEALTYLGTIQRRTTSALMRARSQKLANEIVVEQEDAEEESKT